MAREWIASLGVKLIIFFPALKLVANCTTEACCLRSQRKPPYPRATIASLQLATYAAGEDISFDKGVSKDSDTYRTPQRTTTAELRKEMLQAIVSRCHIDEDTRGMDGRVQLLSRHRRVRSGRLCLSFQLAMYALTLLHLLIRATSLLAKSHGVFALISKRVYLLTT